MNKAKHMQILSHYPKAQPSLPSEYKKIYEDSYLENRGYKGFVGRLTAWLESWMHERVAKETKKNQSVLEIGAGTLNHIPYEVANDYEVIEPMTVLFKDEREKLKKIKNIYKDIQDVRDQKYDRIISIAVLEHLTDLPSIIRKSLSLLKDDGLFQAGIPTEGGFLWYFASYKIKGFFFRRKFNLNYDILMKYEHVNTEKEIIEVVKCFFEEVKIKRFPLPFKHLSLYTYIEAKGKKELP